MRKYIESNLKIDGRNIPYPIFTATQYLTYHDKIDDIETFCEENYGIYELLTQIIALKQSCFLLRHTTHSCQSLSDGLYTLKNRLIIELKEKYNYVFDDEWMENPSSI